MQGPYPYCADLGEDPSRDASCRRRTPAGVFRVFRLLRDVQPLRTFTCVPPFSINDASIRGANGSFREASASRPILGLSVAPVPRSRSSGTVTSNETLTENSRARDRSRWKRQAGVPTSRVSLEKIVLVPRTRSLARIGDGSWSGVQPYRNARQSAKK